jgi:uncharacterized protein involved in oxidation of intracellular sulfur
VNVLLLINDPPYGTEKAYNALRVAITLQKEHEHAAVRVFLMGDAVVCTIPGQVTPQGFYNVERMLKPVLARGGEVKACGSCLDARGLGSMALIEGVQPSNMSELAVWIVQSDKVLTF